MTTSIDRIAELKKTTIPGRLLRGCQVMGRLFQAGDRCQGGFTASCSCSPKNEFCKAKIRWLELLREFYGGWPYELSGNEEFFMIEAMRWSWLEAFGFAMNVEVPGARKPLRFGAKGTIWNTLLDLALIEPGPERDQAMEAVVKLQEAFR